MKFQYTRLFTDARGISVFEDLEAALVPGFAVPPAEPLHSAPFLAPEGATFWIGAPRDWKGGEPHPSPQRMLLVTVRGEYEVTTSDGVARRFPPGSVVINEDTTGRGHSTRITSDDGCIVFVVGLPAQ